MITSVIGIDPGPTTGICLMEFIGPDYPLPEHNITLFQASSGNALRLLEAYLRVYYQDARVTRRFAQVEKFITGNSAGTRSGDADLTRQYVMKFAELLGACGYSVKIRPAADMKPWATPRRLQAAGVMAALGVKPKAGLLPKVPDSMRHAGDGAGHCLFAACRDAQIKDPLA